MPPADATTSTAETLAGFVEQHAQRRPDGIAMRWAHFSEGVDEFIAAFDQAGISNLLKVAAHGEWINVTAGSETGGIKGVLRRGVLDAPNRVSGAP